MKSGKSIRHIEIMITVEINEGVRSNNYTWLPVKQPEREAGNLPPRPPMAEVMGSTILLLPCRSTWCGP